MVQDNGSFDKADIDARYDSLKAAERKERHQCSNFVKGACQQDWSFGRVPCHRLHFALVVGQRVLALLTRHIPDLQHQ